MAGPAFRLRTGDTYALQASAAGLSHAAVWSLNLASGSLPGGITFDAANALVGGTVQGPGSAGFSLSVTDAANNLAGTSAPISLQAAPALGLQGLASTSVGRQGSLLAIKGPQVVGGQGSVELASSSSFPAGTSLQPDGGIAGTPTESVTPARTIRITALDAWDGRSASTQTDLTVYRPLTYPAQPAPQAATTGQSYMYRPVVNDGLGTLAYTLLSGTSDISDSLSTACPGLAFSRLDGTVSGTPTSACSLNLSLKVSDTGNGVPGLAQATTSPAYAFQVVQVQDASKTTSAATTLPYSAALNGSDVLRTIYDADTGFQTATTVDIPANGSIILDFPNAVTVSSALWRLGGGGNSTHVYLDYWTGSAWAHTDGGSCNIICGKPNQAALIGGDYTFATSKSVRYRIYNEGTTSVKVFTFILGDQAKFPSLP